MSRPVAFDVVHPKTVMSAAPLPYPLASAAQFARTPSRADGLPSALEHDLRAYGCRLIQQAGVLLRLPQVAMATAQVLFQRFWYVTSMKQFGIADIAMGALYLASKLEEHPARMRDLINTFDLLLARARHALSSPSSSPSPFTYTPMSYFSSAFYDAKDALVVAEMQILKRLAFNVHVQLPYGTMVNYLRVLGLEEREGMAQRSWGFLNDALQTPVYATYPFPTIACAAIHLAARQLRVPLPEPPEHEPWWILFEAELEDMEQVCGWVLRLYRRREDGDEKRVWGMVGKRDVRRWLEENAELEDG